MEKIMFCNRLNREISDKKKAKLPLEIYEVYSFPPKIDVRKVVENLLLGIPSKYLEDLESVVLCDTPSFMKHYGDKEKIPTARYIQVMDGNAPWIEMCIDRIMERGEGLPLRIPFLRDLIFSESLYHEIGHHLNREKDSEGQDSEAAAETWRGKLQKHYFLRKRFFSSILILTITFPFRRLILRKYKSLKSNSD